MTSNCYTEKFFDIVREITVSGEAYDIDSENFNIALDHICNLLNNASCLYENGSYGTSIFLSITAMEEAAKLYISIFRGENNIANECKGRQDKLFDHKTKHKLACAPTVLMGKRLYDAVEQQAIEAIVKKSYDGALRIERENALYMQRNASGKWLCPETTYGKREARNFLLFAIESIDDALIGNTKKSLDESRYFLDKLFASIAGDDHEADK